MNNITTKPRVEVRTKTKRPPLHKVILVNDDYTPREFVVLVLKAEFRMSEDQAYQVMMTAHRRGVCVVAVYARDIAESKATRATDLGRSKGYPLLFTTEPEESGAFGRLVPIPRLSFRARAQRGSPESITTVGDYGFRARALRRAPE